VTRRDALVDVLVVLTTPRSIALVALVWIALVSFGWFVLELIRSLT